jgi:hypothetical protein
LECHRVTCNLFKQCHWFLRNDVITNFFNDNAHFFLLFLIDLPIPEPWVKKICTLYSILYLSEWSMRSSKPWVALYFFHQICVSCKSNINCHLCHSDSESSSSIHVQISQSYVAKCKYRVSQKWRTNYLLPYPGCLNVHEKNMEKIFQTKK